MSIIKLFYDPEFVHECYINMNNESLNFERSESFKNRYKYLTVGKTMLEGGVVGHFKHQSLKCDLYYYYSSQELNSIDPLTYEITKNSEIEIKFDDGENEKKVFTKNLFSNCYIIGGKGKSFEDTYYMDIENQKIVIKDMNDKLIRVTSFTPDITKSFRNFNKFYMGYITADNHLINLIDKKLFFDPTLESDELSFVDLQKYQYHLVDKEDVVGDFV